jgi:hypothetical protein
MTKEYFDKIIQFVSAAFALVAGLAWNTAIQDLINRYVSAGSGLTGKFIYAIIVTTIAVVVTVYMAKIHDQVIKREEKAEAKRLAALSKR